MLGTIKLWGRRLIFGLALGGVAFGATSYLTGSDPDSSALYAQTPTRGIVRAIMGGSRPFAPTSPSYAAPTVAPNPTGVVRVRERRDETAARQEPVADEPILLDVPAENPEQTEPTAEAVGEAAPEAPAAPAHQDDEDSRFLEEQQQAATEAQGAEVPAEEKAQALSNGSPDAPDARVRLTDLDVDAAKAAEMASEPSDSSRGQANVDIPDAKGSLGYPGAARAVRDMSADLLDQLNARGGAELYARWRAYNASIRSRTNSVQTGNELNNRCRLDWYEKLYQDPLNSVNETEAASRAWAEQFMGTGADILAGVRSARARMDVSSRGERDLGRAALNPTEAIESLKSALVEAAEKHAKSVAPMSEKDVAAVMNEAYSIFCGQVNSGHTINSRGRGQYLIDAIEKMNRGALYDAGETVLSLLNERTLQELSKIDFNSLEKRKIDGDQVVGVISTEAGDILVGDGNKTIWKLDSFPKACCVIDLGGDDEYQEGSCVLNRPLLVVFDFGGGKDRYVGKNYAIQAGAVLGVTMWYDDGGDDYYLAKDICQGSAIGGFAALINEGGNDKYIGFRRAQGAALGGVGLLIDRDGDDDYRAALLAQGFGAPGGFGALVDKAGKDHYYVGGYFFDSYPEHPGYDGWGQGIGAGIRRVACGGIGLILDGAGDDAYEYDYFGHGGGYWMGVGIARDFGGNDIRYAATSTMYDGSRRREQRWQRFGGGFGCHYAVGYLFDDFGNDVYGGTIMGVGMGWDLGAGFLVDFEGDDVFEATGGLTQGAGAQGSIGVIMNFRGADTYLGNSQGYANGQLSYHAQSNCGGNFSFVVDHGGFDNYGGYDNYRRKIQNNAITQRGYSTGLIIDRPSPAEERAAKDGAQQASAQGASQQPAQVKTVTNNGMTVAEGSIKTMVEPPPLYDTTPHATSSGTNAFNPQGDAPVSTGGWGRGGGLFGRGGFF